MSGGEIVTEQDIYAYGLDSNFQWQNDTTNRLTIVDRGDRFAIYTNDTLIGGKPQRYPTTTIYNSAPGSPRGYKWHPGDGKISPENRRVR